MSPAPPAGLRGSAEACRDLPRRVVHRPEVGDPVDRTTRQGLTRTYRDPSSSSGKEALARADRSYSASVGQQRETGLMWDDGSKP